MTESIGNPDAGGVSRRERRLRTAFWVVWAVLLVVKIVLAAQLAPFGDEAWYWQESRHPAWGYSDLPPLTAQATVQVPESGGVPSLKLELKKPAPPARRLGNSD